MRAVGLFEAKQKLSELVQCAGEGERIAITKRGKVAALIVPANRDVRLRDVFVEIEHVRKRAKRKNGPTSKRLIEEGRV